MYEHLCVLHGNDGPLREMPLTVYHTDGLQIVVHAHRNILMVPAEE